MKELKYRMVKKKIDEEIEFKKKKKEHMLRTVNRAKEILKEKFLKFGEMGRFDYDISHAIKEYGLEKFLNEFKKETGVDIRASHRDSDNIGFKHNLFGK